MEKLTQINSKLNVKCIVEQFLEENITKKIFVTLDHAEFLDMT